MIWFAAAACVGFLVFGGLLASAVYYWSMK